MAEYFIVANSFTAPFFSDQSEKFIEAATPQAALESFAANYTHPSGLYAAICYANSDDYHKGRPPLARWLSNHEIAKQEATEGKSCYSYSGSAPGVFEIDDKPYVVADPKGGRVVEA